MTETHTNRLIPVAPGWARNSINAVIFRRNALVTHAGVQYTAFYEESGHVVLAKRNIDSADWEIQQSPYTGNVRDAHNCISLMVDGDGFLHMAWDHHNHPLRYVRSVAPGSLDLTECLAMTGQGEERVTYPQFYRLPNGDLLFFYRDGMSGNGNLMLNHYDLKTQTWMQIGNGFVDGEGERNAYWQATMDVQGTLHLSWVWRETPDVTSNHDLCYARSSDGGRSWQKSTGERYQLPITLKNAEIAWFIPQGHELINQTSMCADALGRPYIATYWRPPGTSVPQYHLVYHDGRSWQMSQVSQRRTPFTLSGVGTRRIPISRPQIVADATAPGSTLSSSDKAYLIFRDAERGDRISLARCNDLQSGRWDIEDLTEESVGQWEPTYDTERWALDRTLHLFVQRVGQGEREGIEEMPPQMVSVLEWRATANSPSDNNPST